MSEVCDLFTPLPQVLKNVKFKSGAPLQDKHVRNSIAEAEAMLGNSGRLVIRPSGTEPVIRVMAEGDDEGLVRRSWTNSAAPSPRRRPDQRASPMVTSATSLPRTMMSIASRPAFS